MAGSEMKELDFVMYDTALVQKGRLCFCFLTNAEPSEVDKKLLEAVFYPDLSKLDTYKDGKAQAILVPVEQMANRIKRLKNAGIDDMQTRVASASYGTVLSLCEDGILKPNIPLTENIWDNDIEEEILPASFHNDGF